MKHIETGSQRQWVKTQKEYLITPPGQTMKLLEKCERARVKISRTLYLINQEEYHKATCEDRFDGFIIRIPGHQGDIAYHEMTYHTYETCYTVEDSYDCYRHGSATGALMALLKTPEKYNSEMDGFGYKITISELMNLLDIAANKTDNSLNDAEIAKDITTYVYWKLKEIL